MFYKYKVSWYDSYADEKRHSKGIVFAQDWNQAVEQMVKSYGHDNVFDLYLKKLLVENDDYYLSKEEIDNAFKED